MAQNDLKPTTFIWHFSRFQRAAKVFPYIEPISSFLLLCGRVARSFLRVRFELVGTVAAQDPLSRVDGWSSPLSSG